MRVYGGAGEVEGKAGDIIVRSEYQVDAPLYPTTLNSSVLNSSSSRKLPAHPTADPRTIISISLNPT